MKLIRRGFGVGKEGFVKLMPESGEDMYHAFNLIREGDAVKCCTTRKVERLNKDGQRTDSSKVTLTIMIKVQKIDFDIDGQELRLSGPNQTMCEHLKLGAMHSLTLELNRVFTLEKAVWEGGDADRIRMACDVTATADLACLLLSDAVAHLMLIGTCTTSMRSKVEVSLPAKKGAASQGLSKALRSYFTKVLGILEQHIDWEVVRCLVIAGPGSTKKEFLEFLNNELPKKEHGVLMRNKQRILLAHASSAYTQALEEVLSNDTVLATIKDTAAAREVAALRDFNAALNKDSDRAFYGPRQVAAAAEVAAVDRLLITDTLLRSRTPQQRAVYGRIVRDVRNTGGQVLVFSGAHLSGQQLDKLTGIAALLRFPLPAIADE